MKRSLLAILVIWVTLAACGGRQVHAQTAALLPEPKAQFFDSSGNPLNAGKVYTYVTGTTTPLATYTDSTAGTPNANPVILDSAGRANIWLSAASYRIVLKTSADVTIWTVDGVAGSINATATGTSGRVPKYTGAITLGGSNIWDNGTTVAIGATTVNTTGMLFIQHTTGRSLVADIASTADGAYLVMRRARGTPASPADVQNTDAIGTILTEAYSGNTSWNNASMTMFVDGAVVSGQRPGSRIAFFTNIPNAITTQKLTIEGDGDILANLGSTYTDTSDISTSPKFVSGVPVIVASATTNASYIQMNVTAGASVHVSSRTSGTGATILPIIFDFGGVERMRLHTNGGLSVGVSGTTSGGAGTINITGDIYKNGSAYTHPDYVFEQYFTGKIEANKDSPGAADYPGLPPIEDVIAHAARTHQLPRVPRARGMFERGDILLEKLEESYLYIYQLHERIKRLETARER